MAKTYTITLGGKEWPLRYRISDAIELKRRFGKPLATLMREDLMGFVERPKPGGDTEWVALGTSDWETQIAFIQIGIRDDKGKPTEKQVTDWLEAMLTTDGKNLGEVVSIVWKALMLSGVTGQSRDVDEPEAEGKA